jgi:hypothetical protein
LDKLFTGTNVRSLYSKVGQTENGPNEDNGPYTTLWVDHPPDGDWPECTGIIDAVTIESLD